MKKLLVGLALTTLCSCGIMNKLTDEQLNQRNKLSFELSEVYNEYLFKTDSLLIEYNKIK